MCLDPRLEVARQPPPHRGTSRRLLCPPQGKWRAMIKRRSPSRIGGVQYGVVIYTYKFIWNLTLVNAHSLFSTRLILAEGVRYLPADRITIHKPAAAFYLVARPKSHLILRRSQLFRTSPVSSPSVALCHGTLGNQAPTKLLKFSTDNTILGITLSKLTSVL
jgi:hypothetical protein